MRYLELAERTLVNQIPFVQAANGAFCYLRGLQNRSGAAFDVCCSHHAPRALWEAMRYAFTTEPGLALGQPLHRRDRPMLTVSSMEVTVSSRLAIEDDDVRARLDLVDAVAGAVRDSRPRARMGRAKPSSSVNGQPAGGPSGRASPPSNGRWSDGDRLSVRFPHRVQRPARSPARRARAPSGRSGGPARPARLLL